MYTFLKSAFDASFIFILNDLQREKLAEYYKFYDKKIEEEKLPYNEIENSISYILNHKSEINDYEVFEFTVLSFFTYFIFQANKKHMYLSIEDRKSDVKVIMNLCEYVQRLLKKYMPEYWKNRYIGIFKNKELQFNQRAGVWLFVKLSRTNLLKAFTKLYYKF